MPLNTDLYSDEFHKIKALTPSLDFPLNYTEGLEAGWSLVIAVLQMPNTNQIHTLCVSPY